MNHVLARETGDIRTGPADELPFDHGYSPTLPGHRPGDRLTARPAAQHDNVVLVRFAHAKALLSQLLPWKGAKPHVCRSVFRGVLRTGSASPKAACPDNRPRRGS